MSEVVTDMMEVSLPPFMVIASMLALQWILKIEKYIAFYVYIIITACLFMGVYIAFKQAIITEDFAQLTVFLGIIFLNPSQIFMTRQEHTGSLRKPLVRQYFFILAIVVLFLIALYGFSKLPDAVILFVTTVIVPVMPLLIWSLYVFDAYKRVKTYPCSPVAR